MQNSKRIFSFVLAMLLLIGAVPASAFASETTLSIATPPANEETIPNDVTDERPHADEEYAEKGGEELATQSELTDESEIEAIQTEPVVLSDGEGEEKPKQTLTSLRLYCGSETLIYTEESNKTDANQKFDPNTFEYSGMRLDTIYEAGVNSSGKQIKFDVETSVEGATVKVFDKNDNTFDITDKKAWANAVYTGKNPIKMVISAEGYEDATYTFNIDGYTTISPIAQDAETGNNLKMFDADGKTASALKQDYVLKVLEGVEKIKLTVSSEKTYHTVKYNGEDAEAGLDYILDIKDKDTVEIMTITTADAVKNSITFKIERLTPAKVTFDAPDDVTITLKDGTVIQKANEDNAKVYDALYPGFEYTYCVLKDSYAPFEGSFIAGEVTSIKAELKEASDIKYQQYESFWPYYRGSEVNMAIVDAQTARTLEESNLKWAVNFGKSYMDSPTPPIMYDGVEVDGKKYDVLVTAANKTLYMIDKETGETLISQAMSGSAGFATNPVAYAEGIIFVQLSGQIQAFDATTLKPLWITEKISGQTISPITYHDGFIYIGLWSGEEKEGTYLAFTVQDMDAEKENETKFPEWTLNHNGGFYWAGAYVTDKYMVFGSDDGSAAKNYTETAVLYSVNPKTGEIIDKIENIKGDIRSTVSYDAQTKAVYASTKGGLLIKAPIDDEGKFNKSEFKTADLGGMCVSCPIVYKGRAYLGTAGTVQFDCPGVLNVVDVETMKIIAGIELPGYPQAPIMAVTGYEESDGKVYFYTTYNSKPSGLNVVEWDIESDTYTSQLMFNPDTSMQNYCLCPVVCDEEGTIYYRNDSGYLMAIEKIVKDNVKGDVNGDGNITTTDATMALSFYYESIELTEDQIKSADVNNDGKVDTVDATRILSFYYEESDTL